MSLTGLDRLYTPSRRFTLEHLQFVDTGEYSEHQTVQNVLEILWLFDRIGKITVVRAFAHEQGAQDFDVLLQRYQYMSPNHLSVGALCVLDRPRGIEFWMALMRRTSLNDFKSLTLTSNQLWDYSALRTLLQDAGPALRTLNIFLETVEDSAVGMFEPHAFPDTHWDCY